MLIYISVGRICAASIEMSMTLSAKPLIAKQRYKNETIIDLPFCRIIFTPTKRLGTEKDITFDQDKDEYKDAGKPDSLYCVTKGDAKN